MFFNSLTLGWAVCVDYIYFLSEHFFKCFYTYIPNVYWLCVYVCVYIYTHTHIYILSVPGNYAISNFGE